MILSLHVYCSLTRDSERILKICQHLRKLWAIKYRVIYIHTYHLLVNSSLALMAVL